MSGGKLILGTRGSALALAQVELVRQALRAVDAGLEIEVKKITTSGDRSQTGVVAARETGAGLKGMFTKEIEDALLSGGIDAAVHSLKDLPGQMPDSLEVMAVLERANTADVLISKVPHDFNALPGGLRIGTSSVRRRKQLLWKYPDWRISEIRGNVPTRLKKLKETPELDGIVLALAGLERLGYSFQPGMMAFDGVTFDVDILETLPAIGQGAIGLEGRADDERTRSVLKAINHEPTFRCIRAERELLRLLNGDCHLPVGVSTALLDGSRMRMKTMIFGDDGQPPLTGEIEWDAEAPEALAAQLFKQIPRLKAGTFLS